MLIFLSGFADATFILKTYADVLFIYFLKYIANVQEIVEVFDARKVFGRLVHNDDSY